jgi:hypothetical protein
MLTLQEYCTRTLVRNPYHINFTCLPKDLCDNILGGLKDSDYLYRTFPCRMFRADEMYELAELIYRHDPSSCIIQVYGPGSDHYEKVKHNMFNWYTFDQMRSLYVGLDCFYILPKGEAVFKIAYNSPLIRYCSGYCPIDNTIFPHVYSSHREMRHPMHLRVREDLISQRLIDSLVDSGHLSKRMLMNAII